MKINFYTEIHKALRRLLYNLAIEVGNYDFHANEGYRQIHQKVLYVTNLLRLHANHEERYLQSFIEQEISPAAHTIQEEHQHQEEELTRLENMSNMLLSLHGKNAIEPGLSFYRAFNKFISDYLAHMEEEERIMELLQALCTEEALFNTLAPLIQNMPKNEAIESIAYLIPAISPIERLNILKGFLQDPNSNFAKEALKKAQDALLIDDWLALKNALQVP